MEKNYESMVILRPDLGDQEQEEVTGKITKKIEDMEGKILASKIWAKEKKFYYFLKGRSADKTKYYKGCYWLVNFMIDTNKLPELKETIRLEERILRNLTINRKIKSKSGIIS